MGESADLERVRDEPSQSAHGMSSVRPILNVTEDVFDRILIPFDPIAEETNDSAMGTSQGGDLPPAVERSVMNPAEIAVNPAPDEQDGDDLGDHDEGMNPRIATLPIRPTKDEVEAHMITHVPYRSWCPHCVRGKSKGLAHRRQSRDHEIPTVAIDYMFMTDTQREDEEVGMPILVSKDLIHKSCGTGMISARVVPQKGLHAYAVKQLSQDLENLGHSSLIFKSDGEPSIVALKTAVKNERSERIVLETSPVKESKSNGAIENAIQQVQGQVRAVKDCLEGRLNNRLSGSCPVFAWLVIHAAKTLNRYHIGEDGKTAYQRWKGKPFRREVTEFGECVMYLKAGTSGRDKLQPRWERGVWLGIRDESGEIIIGTPEGVVKARDFKRLPSLEERWNFETICAVQGTPWEPVPGRSGDSLPVRVHIAEEGSVPVNPDSISTEPPKDIKRRARITREDVVRLGFTHRCPGCIAISRDAPSQNHTEECRNRLEEALLKEGGIKAKRIKTGLDRYEEHKNKKRGHETDSPEDPNPVGRRDPTRLKRSDVAGNKRDRNPENREADLSDEEHPSKFQVFESNPQGSGSASSTDNVAVDLIKFGGHESDALLSRAIDSMSAPTDFEPDSQVSFDTYWDDLSGKPLSPELVLKARTEEMGEILKHNVYEKVPISQCWNETGQPPVGTRWVDVNKGDDQNVEYRSRLVAQELNTHKRQDLFAATPPLEAKKLLMSLATTEGIGFQAGCKSKGFKLDFIDVRRAYFHAKARRTVFIKLPPEDFQEGMCGKLNKSLYGTRDAAQNWEHAYIEFLESIGFVSGVASPCIFHNKDKNVRVVVHGDDFTLLGSADNLDWFRKEISKRFEVKFRGRLGPGDKDDKSIRILNRVITWSDDGIEYEADQRHAELIIRHLGLKSDSKPVGSPSTKTNLQNDELLNSNDATLFRALSARANYLTQDRSDIGFAVKELCRNMAKPKNSDWEKLKRLGRYLIDKTRVIVKFHYQSMPEEIQITVDTDHAGCLETRKSTSGGVAMFGSHCIKSWASTQQVIATSSGEAEYYGMVKGASNGFGISGMLRDSGVDIGVTIRTDSSAAKGIASRRGLGKVRHIELAQLWLQDQVARGRVRIEKIRGEDNFADSLTKHASPERILQTMRCASQQFARGRHEIMPNVAE